MNGVRSKYFIGRRILISMSQRTMMIPHTATLAKYRMQILKVTKSERHEE